MSTEIAVEMTPSPRSDLRPFSVGVVSEAAVRWPDSTPDGSRLKILSESAAFAGFEKHSLGAHMFRVEVESVVFFMM
ncbi:MAG: hypothetical protein WCJ04_08600 [Actinomycetes bacterium]